MTKKSLDEKYSYQIDEHNVVHLFRGEEDCQQLLTNPLLSAIFKIESLEKENKMFKKANEIIAQQRDDRDADISKLEEENQRLSNLVASYMTGEEE